MKFESWADYVYPGSDVLRNLEDIRDGALLRQFEEEAVRARSAEILYAHPVDGNFDREHMKAIHRRLFGDVYEWAGHERVGPSGFMTKGGPSPDSIRVGDYGADDQYPHQYFPANDAMLKHFDNYCELLNRDDLRGVEPRVFVEAIDVPPTVTDTSDSAGDGPDDYQPMYSEDEYAEKFGDES